ncbi:MAG TPA: PEP/pyruvate-binding domain-containing protein, partial [Cytophagales bacterium]|nr:PEP/pyruvate-binding domain-containing protein [Cytophagales bacterium]
VVYDLKNKEVYFINSFFFKFHYEFCLAQFQSYPGLPEFNAVEYSSDSNRLYGLANINYFESNKVYALEFFADDELPTPRLVEMFEAIKSRACFAKDFKLFMNSNAMQKRKSMLTETKIPLLDPDAVFKAQTYQAMNKGIAYGYLKIIDSLGNDTKITPDDIIFTRGLPNELPLCRAIVTTSFQTPLCHINILSHNRGTPNAVWKHAFEDASIAKLKDKLVRLEVKDQMVLISEADLKTAAEAWKVTKDSKLISLKCDFTKKGLQDATKLRLTDIGWVGGKAANFGELARIRVWKQPLPLPEGAFAIPFYYYQEHIKRYGIDVLIDSMLSKPPSEVALLERQLKAIRKRIKESKLNDTLLLMIQERMKAGGTWQHYRFRSSTNAEDVAGFNGAGLYSSKTGSLSDSSKPIEKAIKSVWASLWNIRAYQERDYFNIDQHQVFMGVLCHRSFGDESVNGVVVTRNLYRHNYPGLVINLQKGEHSVVLPEDSLGCEQLLITMPLGNDDNLNKIGIDHIAFSGFSPQKSLLSKAELVQLVRYSRAIKSHFYLKKHTFYNYSKFEDFAMDIEFKLEKKTRKLYIKQAREY